MKLLLFLFLALLATPTLGGYERFEENGKVGLKDEQGKIILPASFDALGWSDGHFTLIGEITGYRKKDHWGLLNIRKQIIAPAIFESMTSPGGDRIVASKLINPYTVKFGCLDLQGKTVIPFMYDEIVLQGMRAIVMIKNGTRYMYGLTDLDDKSILPVKYRSIVPLGSLRYAVANFENKLALADDNGQWVTRFDIDSISSFRFNYAVFHQGWQKGLVDRNGQIKIPPHYREIDITTPTQIRTRLADQWVIRNDHFEELYRTEADDLVLDPSGLHLIRLNGKSGLVNNEFGSIVPPVFDVLSKPDHHLMVGKKGGKWGLTHVDQSVVLPFQFDSLAMDGNNVRSLQSSKWQLYDTVGVCKTNGWYERMEPFNGRFFPVRQRGFWGGVDRYGQTRIACVYDSLYAGKINVWCVKFKGQFGIINSDDHWVVLPGNHPLQLLSDNRYLEKQDSLSLMKDMEGNMLYFTSYPLELHEDHITERLPDGSRKEINFQGQVIPSGFQIVLQAEEVFRESEGLTRIRKHNKYGFVDKRGRLRIANRYEAAGDFHEGLASVKILGKWGFIDAADQIIVQPAYDEVTAFSEHMSMVKRNGRFGLISSEGKIILELKYDSLTTVPGGYYILHQGAVKGLANAKGRVLIEPRFDSIQLIDENRVIVSQRHKFGILAIDGMSVVPLQYQMLKYDAARKNFVVHERAEWEDVNLE